MVYCVQANFLFRNAARRDQVQGNIENRLGQVLPWGEIICNDYTAPNGAHALAVETRFRTAEAQQTFWDGTNNILDAGESPLPNSVMSRHDCSHDESKPVPCVIAEQRDF